LFLLVQVAGCSSRSLPNADAQWPATGDDAGMSDLPTSAPTLSPCPSPAWQEPTEIISFSDRHATAPSMVVLNSGSGGEPAKVAVQSFASGGSSWLHPDLQIARVSLGQGPWPKLVQVDKQPMLLGSHAHGWGEMARTAQGLALAWYGDPIMNQGHPRLRRLDSSTWKASPAVEVWTSGEAVLGLASGKDTTGEHFAIGWRDVQVGGKAATARPQLALLDAQGKVTAGPWPAAPAEPYPGRTATLIWSGSTYLAALGYERCDSGGAPCQPRSVGVLRVDPAGPPTPVAWFPAAANGTPGRRVALSVLGESVWVAWFEGGATDDAPRSVHLARLARAGATVAGPLQVANGAHPSTALRLAATPFGLVLLWAEEGDKQLAPDQPGHSRLVLVWLDLDGKPLHGSRTLAVTRVDTYNAPDVVAVQEPPSVLLLWSGTSRKAAQVHDVAHLAGMDCSGGYK